MLYTKSGLIYEKISFKDSEFLQAVLDCQYKLFGSDHLFIPLNQEKTVDVLLPDGILLDLSATGRISSVLIDYSTLKNVKVLNNCLNSLPELFNNTMLKLLLKKINFTPLWAKRFERYQKKINFQSKELLLEKILLDSANNHRKIVISNNEWQQNELHLFDSNVQFCTIKQYRGNGLEPIYEFSPLNDISIIELPTCNQINIPDNSTLNTILYSQLPVCIPALSDDKNETIKINCNEILLEKAKNLEFIAFYSQELNGKIKYLASIKKIEHSLFNSHAEITFSTPVLKLENKKIMNSNLGIQDGVYLVNAKQLTECESLDLLKLYSTV